MKFRGSERFSLPRISPDCEGLRQGARPEAVGEVQGAGDGWQVAGVDQGVAEGQEAEGGPQW